MRREAAARRLLGRRIGLVPTMGCLHEGHLSLVRRAGSLADCVVVSIFVNPTQFGPNEDFSRYPREFERDSELCREAGVDVLFHPSAAVMYEGEHSVYVDEQRLAAGLCGRSRPGHFRGVLTVVAKLFNIVQPDVAVFGGKDAQQARLVQQMVHDLNFPIDVVVGSTVREPDGLAMSSRNRYLSPADRAGALCLRRGLLAAEGAYRRGERSASSLRAAVDVELRRVPGVRVEYLDVVGAVDLQPVEHLASPTLIAVAARVGETRLIDNITLGGDA
jgi:pantoate--beta-alanine ligase